MISQRFGVVFFLCLFSLCSLGARVVFAGDPMAAQEQQITKGVTGCIEKIQSCTDVSKLQSAWQQGMAEAKIAIGNYLLLFWQLWKQAPVPTPPSAPPGEPGVGTWLPQGAVHTVPQNPAPQQ